MERTKWRRRRIERKWRRGLGVSSSPSKWTAFPSFLGLLLGFWSAACSLIIFSLFERGWFCLNLEGDTLAF